MTDLTLADLQASVQDRLAFNNLNDYVTLCEPEMTANPRLREQIFDFQQFLLRDMWTLSNT